MVDRCRWPPRLSGGLSCAAAPHLDDPIAPGPMATRTADAGRAASGVHVKRARLLAAGEAALRESPAVHTVRRHVDNHEKDGCPNYGRTAALLRAGWRPIAPLLNITAGQSVIQPGGETFHSSSQYPQIIVDNRVDGGEKQCGRRCG